MDVGRRRVRRATAICLMILAAMANVTAATASPPGTRFEARSHGLPVATGLGHWDATDTRATLVFTGANPVGSKTSFVAEWKTPMLPGDARFNGSGTLTSVQPEGAVIQLHKYFRYRMDSDGWSRWLRSSFRQTAMFTYREDFERVGIVGAQPKRIQYHWKLTGTMKEPASLTGQFELTAD
jgi:hypothetical protein